MATPPSSSDEDDDVDAEPVEFQADNNSNQTGFVFQAADDHMSSNNAPYSSNQDAPPPDAQYGDSHNAQDNTSQPAVPRPDEDENAQFITVLHNKQTVTVPYYDDTTLATLRDAMRKKLTDTMLTDAYSFVYIKQSKIPLEPHERGRRRGRKKKKGKRRLRKKRNSGSDDDDDEDMLDMEDDDDDDDDDDDEDMDDEDEFKWVEEEIEFDSNDRLSDILDQHPLLLTGEENLETKWNSFFLTIEDGDEMADNVEVDQYWTIERLLEYMENEREPKIHIEKLCYEGQELFGNTSLDTNNIRQHCTLIGRIRVTVEDIDCDEATDIFIRPSWDIDFVLKTYLEATRREKHSSAHFELDGRMVQTSDSVYHLGITKSATLIYKVGPYSVKIFDTDQSDLQPMPNGGNRAEMEGVEVTVMDHYTLEEVKQAYSRQTKKPFLPDEKFLSDERQLEDNVPLWKLRLRDGERLVIERQQYEVAVEYICAECGATVKLRRQDDVACRECFHLIVFKKRTTRVCQYNCR